MVNFVPDGFPRVTPYLNIDGASEAISFYIEVLGATERFRMPGPDGKIGHAEIAFGDSVVMLADLCMEGQRDPVNLGGSPVTIMLYVPDVDATYVRAVAAGAKGNSEPEDKFYGDRGATITDPWGHEWHLATHVEDVSEEEMDKRMKAMMGG
ncbi:MAG TPA: VOC family protein [Sporichthyaceae bacterium]|nr:VOC family protein [Sporichthyaceae bacterium]